MLARRANLYPASSYVTFLIDLIDYCFDGRILHHQIHHRKIIEKISSDIGSRVTIDAQSELPIFGVDYLDSLREPESLTAIVGMEVWPSLHERALQAQRAATGGTLAAARLANV